jgi:2-dehydropantoate 2-reductase
MKHAILGAGAVGSLVGAALAYEGDDVTLLVRPETRVLHSGRLRLEGPLGKIEAPVRLETRLVRPVDVLWVTTKAPQLIAALHAIPDGSEEMTIVPLLNGIDHVAVLRSRFGQESVVPGTIAVEAERVAPAYIVQRSPFARLALSAAGAPQLEGVAERLVRMGFSCEFHADERTMLWSKLAFLAPFALTTTACEYNKESVFDDPEWRVRLESAVGEACAVAVAEGATVDRSRILAIIGSLPPAMRSSMQKDVAAGRMPELDAIGGPIFRAGRRHGIDVATTHELMARIEFRLSSAFHYRPEL